MIEGLLRYNCESKITIAVLDKLFSIFILAASLIYNSIIREVLGETPVEDYPEGDSECYFSTETIDVSGIAPSSLANSGMLHGICSANTKIVSNSKSSRFEVSDQTTFCLLSPESIFLCYTFLLKVQIHASSTSIA